MKQGKVRDILDEGDTLLLVSTNRLSAFDRHIGDIPGKGTVLNQLSAWWFNKTAPIVTNHFLGIVTDNTMRVKKCRVFPIEVVVRGYITGSTSTSLWTLYNQGEREVFGEILPDGLKKNQKLPKPILTPTTKSTDHDRPLTRHDLSSIPGLTAILWEQIEQKTLALYEFSSNYALQKGLILADTKYEFGLDKDNQLCLIDELHTPDSSRYWALEDWQKTCEDNQEPPSYDKEIVRLWLHQQCDPYCATALPPIPPSLVHEMTKRYQQLYQKITSRSLACAALSE